MTMLENMEYHRPSTWPSPKELKKMELDGVVNFLRKVYESGIFREIEKIEEIEKPNSKNLKYGGVGHIALISICCALDSLSGFCRGKENIKNKEVTKSKAQRILKRVFFLFNDPFESSGEGFKDFIERFFPERYNQHKKRIYTIFRNASVHGWNLFEGTITGIKNDPNHLKVNRKGVLQLSLVDFFTDLKKAFNVYLNEIIKDEKLAQNFFARYKYQWKKVRFNKPKPFKFIRKIYNLDEAGPATGV